MTEQLNLCRDGEKLWNLAAALNDKKPRSSQSCLREKKTCTGEQAAIILVRQYADTSDLHIPTDRNREISEERYTGSDHKEEPIMSSPFVTKELEDAITTLKFKKAPSPDNITNEMFLHLGPRSEKKLLQQFNNGWRTGTVPQVWREAIMIPIHKKGKDKSKIESYRPISLTSCVGILMKTLIKTRFMCHLEDKTHITLEQAAFRQDRSTEHQITYISQAIEDAFNDKKNTLAAWIDLEKAFDKVWKEGLKLKLSQCDVAGRMHKWLGQYMYNRKAKVQVKQDVSKRRTLRQGVPQGGVLSPTLFLVFIRYILHQTPKNIQGVIYADGLAYYCGGVESTTANYTLQQALQVTESRARA